MRNINCRNVQREMEEAAPGDLPSVVVSAHLESCVVCAKLSREQANLQAIISSLGTVEAPGDFDFRLRARLAEEKRGAAQPSALRDFSFGFRSAAVAMVLLLIGAAFVFVSLRTRVENPTTASMPKVDPKPVKPSENVAGQDGVKTAAPEVAVASHEGQAGHQETPRPRVPRREFVALGGNRVGTRDISSRLAPVFRPDDRLAEAYPTAAFPIDASYQSLKVSVDDGRGTSRTISLPTVSFGSQRALSQSASPLMASARGVW